MQPMPPERLRPSHRNLLKVFFATSNVLQNELLKVRVLQIKNRLADQIWDRLRAKHRKGGGIDVKQYLHQIERPLPPN